MFSEALTLVSCLQKQRVAETNTHGPIQSKIQNFNLLNMFIMGKKISGLGFSED